MLDALSHYAAGLVMAQVGFYHSKADDPPASYAAAGPELTGQTGD